MTTSWLMSRSSIHTRNSRGPAKAYDKDRVVRIIYLKERRKTNFSLEKQSLLKDLLKPINNFTSVFVLVSLSGFMRVCKRPSNCCCSDSPAILRDSWDWSEKTLPYCSFEYSQQYILYIKKCILNDFPLSQLNLEVHGSNTSTSTRYWPHSTVWV